MDTATPNFLPEGGVGRLTMIKGLRALALKSQNFSL